MRRYRPDILAMEEVYYAQARSSFLLSALIAFLRILGRKHRLRIERILPTEVKRYFCIGQRTRQSLAEAMSRRYSFLATFLHQHRTRTYWQQMFDAVALGTFVACQIGEPEGIQTRDSPSRPQQSTVA
jgi:predicted secreted Zn-dependent protease